jgi:hypothetical protein
LRTVEERAAAFAAFFFSGDGVEVSKPPPKVIGYTILVRCWNERRVFLMGSSIIMRNSMGLRPIINSSQALPLSLRIYAG